MTHPEAAMTREQVLEEALREVQNAKDLCHAYDIAKAALASTRQEPAPVADAEEVARNDLTVERRLEAGSSAYYVVENSNNVHVVFAFREGNDISRAIAKAKADGFRLGMQYVRGPDKLAKTHVAGEIEASALRRYAGGGGETWQPIETAPKDGTHILAIDADEPFPPSTVHYFNEGDGTGGWCLSVVAKEEEFYRTPTDWMSLPASPAARAKSGEKGGADD